MGGWAMVAVYGVLEGFFGVTPDGEDAIAVDRLDGSPMLFNGRGGCRNEGVEDGGCFFRRADFAVGGKIADVGVECDDVAPCSINGAGWVAVGEGCCDRWREVASKVGVDTVAFQPAAGVFGDGEGDSENEEEEAAGEPLKPDGVAQENSCFDGAGDRNDDEAGKNEPGDGVLPALQREKAGAAEHDDEGEERGGARGCREAVFK